MGKEFAQVSFHRNPATPTFFRWAVNGCGAVTRKPGSGVDPSLPSEFDGPLRWTGSLFRCETGWHRLHAGLFPLRTALHADRLWCRFSIIKAFALDVAVIIHSYGFDIPVASASDFPVEYQATLGPRLRSTNIPTGFFPRSTSR